MVRMGERCERGEETQAHTHTHILSLSLSLSLSLTGCAVERKVGVERGRVCAGGVLARERPEHGLRSTGAKQEHSEHRDASHGKELVLQNQSSGAAKAFGVGVSLSPSVTLLSLCSPALPYTRCLKTLSPPLPPLAWP